MDCLNSNIMKNIVLFNFNINGKYVLFLVQEFVMADHEDQTALNFGDETQMHIPSVAEALRDEADPTAPAGGFASPESMSVPVKDEAA